MTDFPRNRYNSDELISLFESEPVEECEGDYFKSLKLSNGELDFYFPSENNVVNDKYIETARRVILNIRLLDNLVQDSCESEYIRTKLHVRNFMLYLASVEIKKNEVALRYYGEKVNTEWDAIFREDADGKWEKVNF